MDRRMPRTAARAFLAVTLAASLAACAAGTDGDEAAGDDPSGNASPKNCTVSANLVPSCGAWWGVTPVIGARQDPAAAVRDFERKTGRSVDIYHGYHSGSQLFPSASEIGLTRESGKHRMLVLNWKPDVGKT